MSGKILKSLINPAQPGSGFIELRKAMSDAIEVADTASPRFDHYLNAAKKSAAEKPAWRSSGLFRSTIKTEKS